MIIKSRSNQKIKQLKKLVRSKKERDLSELFVAEGDKVVRDIAYNFEPVEIFCTEKYAQKNEFSVSLTLVEESVLNSVSDLDNVQNVIAVFKKPKWELKDILNAEKFTVILGDRLQDPANIGVIIRSCYCLGADALILTEGSVDLYSPKIVRASSSYISKLPVFNISLNEVLEIKKEASFFVASASETEIGVELKQLDKIPEKAVFVFGNEGQGLNPDLIDKSDTMFTIGMRQEAESLNVSVAVAVTLYTINKIL